MSKQSELVDLTQIGEGNVSAVNATLTGYLRGPATFTIDPAAHADNTGLVVIAGNLQVDGTTTTINSTTLTVDDKNITLASGSANASAASGAGFTVDIGSGTLPSITYDGTNDEWDFNKPLNVTGTGKFSGDVGVGATPTARLDVRRAGASGKIAEFHQNAGYGIDIGSSQEVAYISSGYNQRLDFKTDPATGQIERMSILANGKVGIGTSSPNDILDIRKANSQLRLTDSDDNKFVQFSYSGGKLITRNNSTSTTVNQTTLTEDGKFGIGTISPDYKLDVRDGIIFAGRQVSDQGSISYANTAAAFSSVGVAHTDARSNVLRLLRDGTSAVKYAGVADFDLESWETSGVTSRTAMILKLGHNNLPDTTDVMTWRSNGNVGIGTTAPAYKLDVYEATGNGLRIKAGDQIVDVALSVGSAGTADKFVIQSGGNVGIGTETPKTTLDLGTSSQGRRLTFTNYSNLTSEYSNASLWLSSNFYPNAGATGYKTGATGNYGASAVRVHGTGGGSNSGIIQFYTDANSSKTADTAFTPTERLRLGATGALELGYGGAARQQADGQAFTITTPASGGGQGIAFKRLDTNNDQQLGEISWSNNTQDGQANIRVKTEGAVNTTDMHFDVNNAGTLVTALSIDGSAGGDVLIGSTTNLNVLSGTPKIQVGKGNSHSSMQFYSGPSHVGALYFGDGSTGGGDVGTNGRYPGYIEYRHGTDEMAFRAGATDALALASGYIKFMAEKNVMRTGGYFGEGYSGANQSAQSILGSYKYLQYSNGTNVKHYIRPPQRTGYLNTLVTSAAGTNFYAEITVMTTGTGTTNMWCKYSYEISPGQAGTLTHISGNSGQSSNRPYMGMDGGNAYWAVAHSGGYNMDIRVDVMAGGISSVTYLASSGWDNTSGTP